MAATSLSFPAQHETVVATQRLTLRPVVNEDLAAIHAMRLNPMVMQFMPGVETEQDAMKSFSVKRMELMMQQGRFSFAVHLLNPLAPESVDPETTTTSSTVIGFIGITQPPEIFYIFDEKYWGRGYSTEALQAFLRTYWAAFPAGLPGVEEEIRDCLEAHVNDGNVRSERVLEKCGFKWNRESTTIAHGREIVSRIYSLKRPAGEAA